MTEPSPAPNLPVFYARPVPLDARQHASWRLLGGDAAFAADTPWLPITVSEFVASSRCYPIVFVGAGREVSPVAVLGLEKANLFVEAGRWAEDVYVPAYVRRYPFVLIAAPDRQTFALGIDEASSRIAQGGEAGVALFEPGGAAAEITKQAMEFCRLFNLDAGRTGAFCQALADAGVLAERRAEVALNSGRKLGLVGFQVIDPQKLLELPIETVLEWHRSGWLALAYYHLSSMDRFLALVPRQSRRDGAPAAAPAAKASETPPPAPVTEAPAAEVSGKQTKTGGRSFFKR